MTAALSVLSPNPAVLEGLPLAIDRDEVLRFQGYKKDVDVPSADRCWRSSRKPWRWAAAS